MNYYNYGNRRVSIYFRDPNGGRHTRHFNDFSETYNWLLMESKYGYSWEPQIIEIDGKVAWCSLGQTYVDIEELIGFFA